MIGEKSEMKRSKMERFELCKGCNKTICYYRYEKIITSCPCVECLVKATCNASCDLWWEKPINDFSKENIGLKYSKDESTNPLDFLDWLYEKETKNGYL
jgi:hypothetical protein